jgi:ubiquinone/menaquinone biosynthesis C-methylase UbiE
LEHHQVKLNFWEKLLVNNPARAFIQHHVEARRLLRLGGRLDGKKVLEIGCGRGVGVEVIFERFGAAQVTAIDLDPKMVNAAKGRLKSYAPERLSLAVGEATSIEASDATFDAVFDFGVLHHVPDWQKAIGEIARVLKPGGLFYFEEVTKQALDRWVYRTFLDHPRENRFGVEEFTSQLSRRGIIADRTEHILSRDIFAGVGKRV